MTLVNLLVWVTVLLTGTVSICFFRCLDAGDDLIEQGVTVLILKHVSFFLSLGVTVFGLVYTIQFRKTLSQHGVAGGGSLMASMILMLLATLVSLQSITGINIYFSTLAVSLVSEIFSDLSITGMLSLLAMILFMIAVILNYIGIYRITKGRHNIAAALTGLTEVRKSSLVLMIAIILVSPILVSYIAANRIKYENTTLFNVITAVVYLGTVVYYLITWFKAKNISIIPSNEIVEPKYVPLDSSLRNQLLRTGKWYLYTWIVILTSFLSLAIYYLSGSRIMAVITLIPYIVGWIMIIQGVRISSELNGRLKNVKLNCGSSYIVSYIVLGIVSFLSFNTLVGGNVVSIGTFNWEDISEIFSECSDIYSLTSMIEFTSLISLFLFIFFPILLLIGTIKLSLIIPNLRQSAFGAGLLTLASVIFAPLLIFIAIEEYDDVSLVYLVLSIICYAIGIFYYSRPWGKCDKILANYASESNSDDLNVSNPKIDYKKLAMGILTDPKTLIMSLLAIVAIIISFITVISYVTPNNKNNNLSNHYLNEALDVDAIEVVEINSENDHSEIYEVEGGNVHQDDYPDMEKEVEDFVNMFYSEVIPKINNFQNYDNLIKKYFTSEFFNLYSTVDEDVEPGDIGFFDFDFISESQDPNVSKAVVVSVEVTEHGNTQFTSDVNITLKDGGGNTTAIDMSLIKTPKGWKIKDYNDTFNEMKRFKREMKSQR